MKQSCHCSFEKRCRRLKARKIGKVGAVLLCLHLLYHIAEALLLPTIVVGVSRHLMKHDEKTNAVERAEQILFAERPSSLTLRPDWSYPKMQPNLEENQ